MGWFQHICGCWQWTNTVVPGCEHSPTRPSPSQWRVLHRRCGALNSYPHLRTSSTVLHWRSELHQCKWYVSVYTVEGSVRQCDWILESCYQYISILSCSYVLALRRINLCPTFHFNMSARLAQLTLVGSLTSNQEVRGLIPGLVEGWTLSNLLSPHRPWTGTLSRWSNLSAFYRSKLMPMLWTVEEGHWVNSDLIKLLSCVTLETLMEILLIGIQWF